jgi:RNA polymerase sigma factor (sigma-70 family)
MGKITAGVLMRHLRRLAPGGQADPATDGDLLRRYATQRDEAAFAVLVRRHGPMVWNACRRALRDHQDAEDVFQATFLVLAKKAGTVRWRDSAAGWLYAVALRLAARARCQAARRPLSAVVEPAAPDPFEAMSARDLLAALDEELAALPERYRGPAVLCWLEGRTQQEAARLLGWSLRTLRRRLERGKQLLHARLTRRGMTLTVALAAPALANAVPPNSLEGAACGAASPRAAALARALLPSAVGKVRAALALALVCFLAVGVGLAVFRPPEEPAVGDRKEEQKVAARPAPTPRRTDALGDPLPTDAVLRLGSVRFRNRSSQGVAFSPDGKWLACGGSDPRILLWDPQTGKEMRTLLGPKQGVWALAFSPDGKYLAGAGFDGIVPLWDVATGKTVRQLKGVKDSVRAVAFSPKGDLLAAGDAAVRLWDAETGNVLHTFEVEKGDISSVAFDPDGRVVAASCGDKAVRVWDVAGGKLLHRLPVGLGAFAAVAFSADGKTLVTVGEKETLLWDPASGKKLGALAGSKGGSCGVFSPDGKLLAVGGSDQRVHVWDWQTRKELLQTRRHPDRVRSLAFSPDGQVLASVGDATPVHLWDTATGQPKLALPGHQERLNSVAYTPDRGRILTCAWDGTARMWDARTGKELLQLEVGPDKGKTFESWQHPEFLGKIVVSPDGKLAAVTRGDGTVVVCDLATGKEVRRYQARCLAFSPDGKWVAVAGGGATGANASGGTIALYDRATGELRRELRGHLTAVVELTFAPDSQTLFSRGQVHFGLRSGDPGDDERKHVRAWDVATGKQRRSIGDGSYPNAMTLAPDGRTVAVVGRSERTVFLLEALTGGQRGEVTADKNNMTFEVAFSPDGRTLATADMGGAVRLWELPSCREIGRLEGHRGWVQTVAFSPDGTRLVSGGLDTTGLVWDVSRFTKRPAKAAALTEAELEACWEDLGGSATRAYPAFARLLAAPKRAAAFLGGRVKPAPSADAWRLAALLAGLGNEQFQAREQATRELEKLGEVALPALRKALAGDPPLEVKRRLEVLLEKMEGASLPSETLRPVRAVEVLEYIGTAEARAIVERLARDGAAEARLTREAEAALRRMK